MTDQPASSNDKLFKADTWLAKLGNFIVNFLIHQWNQWLFRRLTGHFKRTLHEIISDPTAKHNALLPVARVYATITEPLPELEHSHAALVAFILSCDDLQKVLNRPNSLFVDDAQSKVLAKIEAEADEAAQRAQIEALATSAQAHAHPDLKRLDEALEALAQVDFTRLWGLSFQTKYQHWREHVVTEFLKGLETQLNRLNRIAANSFDIATHVDALKHRLDQASLEQLLAENEGDLMELYRTLHDAFDQRGLIALNRLATIPEETHRIHKLETLIDLYNQKIHGAESDDSLTEAVRERKVQSLQHLMEKDIEALGATT